METFYKIQDFLAGRKSYIVAVILAIYEVIKAFDLIVVTSKQDATILVLIGALLATTISAKINRVSE